MGGDKTPKKIVVCMIYYPDEAQTGSWADTSLGHLKYDNNPEQLQLCIRKMYELATAQVEIPGVEVVPCPLFQVLDGKTTGDYCERVEPSPQGGLKMANAFLDVYLGAE